jgi:type I restriction enzyme S subunit
VSFPAYPEYKDSGVPWLGQVPAHWQISRIKEQFEIRKRIAGELGHDVLSITQSGLRVKDIESNEGQQAMDYSKYQLVYPGDFAMNHMDLLTGWIDIAHQPGVTSPDYRVFASRFPDKIDARFSLRAFQMAYSARQFYPFGQGSSQLGRWRLPTDAFYAFPIPNPPVVEQQAIAAFLDRETAKIDALVVEQERLIALLKGKRQAVISHAVTKGLNPDAPMKDSGIEWLGEIPAHWEVLRFKHIGDAITGLTYSPDDVVAEDGTLVLRSSNVQSGKIALGDNVYVNLKPPEALMVQPNDILVCSRNGSRALIGKNAMLTNDHVGMTWGAFMTVFRSSMPRWSFWVLNSEIFEHQSSTFLTATINQLTIGNFLSMTGPFPPSDEQAEIDQHLTERTEELDRLVAEARSAIALLQERRAALISAAVTGRIDVRGLVDAPAPAALETA